MIWEWPYSLEFLDIISPRTDIITYLTLEFLDTCDFERFVLSSSSLGGCRWGSLKHIALIEWHHHISVYPGRIPLPGTPSVFLSSLRLDELVFEVTIDRDVYGWLRSYAFENIVTLIVHTGMNYLYSIIW
jgi:hypothetical protein